MLLAMPCCLACFPAQTVASQLAPITCVNWGRGVVVGHGTAGPGARSGACLLWAPAAVGSRRAGGQCGPAEQGHWHGGAHPDAHLYDSFRHMPPARWWLTAPLTLQATPCAGGPEDPSAILIKATPHKAQVLGRTWVQVASSGAGAGRLTSDAAAM